MSFLYLLLDAANNISRMLLHALGAEISYLILLIALTRYLKSN